MPWLKQFIPLRTRTSDPADKEAQGISIARAEQLFTGHKNYVVGECYVVTKGGEILRSVLLKGGFLGGIECALRSLGGNADSARFIVTTNILSGNKALIRLYKLPSPGVMQRWQELMYAHRTPEQIATDEEHAQRCRIRQDAIAEAERMLQDA